LAWVAGSRPKWSPSQYQPTASAAAGDRTRRKSNDLTTPLDYRAIRSVTSDYFSLY